MSHRETDLSAVTLENLEFQFCSDYLKSEFRRLITELADLREKFMHKELKCDELRTKLLVSEAEAAVMRVALEECTFISEPTPDQTFERIKNRARKALGDISPRAPAEIGEQGSGGYRCRKCGKLDHAADQHICEWK